MAPTLGMRRQGSTASIDPSATPREAAAARIALAGTVRVLEDGHVEADNNVIERSIRPLGLTRKKALFAGSDGSAEHWAMITSLIETCKLIGVKPYTYLADVIKRIVDRHPNNRLDELLPWAYPAASNSRPGLRVMLT
jgi:transposase